MTRDTTSFVPQLQMRTALRTRVGLSVEPSVARIVVFRRTFREHLEDSHRRARAIVGQRFDNSEARPAVGAVGERIAISAIGRIENLSLTFAASCNVWQDQRGLDRKS